MLGKVYSSMEDTLLKQIGISINDPVVRTAKLLHIHIESACTFYDATCVKYAPTSLGLCKLSLLFC